MKTILLHDHFFCTIAIFLEMTLPVVFLKRSLWFGFSFTLGCSPRLCSMRFAKVVPCSNGSTHLGGTLFSCFRFAFVKHLFFTHQLFHVLIFHFITVLRGFCDLVYCCDATEQFFCFWNQKRRRHQRFCNHGSHFQGGDKLDLLFCSLFVFFPQQIHPFLKTTIMLMII